MEVLISEIDPHVTYDTDGSWSVHPGAQLTPAAKAFVTEALSASANFKTEAALGQSASTTQNALVSAGYRDLKFYWWGARISLASGDAQGIGYSWRTSGGSAAVSQFLGYFGYSGWAVGAAAVLVPAYAATIWLVDRIGGYRGVHLHVPWTIIPTYITPQ